MSGAPAVSAVIPAYNREATIERAARSVLDQDFRDLELIVVDDASTDGTVRVVEALGDPRVRLLQHDANRRAAAARNTGIRAARGRYVAFLDSDDEWLPGKLTAQLRHLEAAPDEVRASCTGYEILRWGVPFPKVPSLTTFPEILMGCDLAPTALVVRRDVFDTVGLLDETFGRYEDWDWLVRYTMRFRMGILPDILARHHRGAGYPPARPLERDAHLLLERHAASLAALRPAFARKVRALRWFELAEHFYRERDFGPGTAYLLKAVGTWPLVRPGMYVLVLDALFGVPLQRALWRMRRRTAGAAGGA
jgi:glycosyltransferase involved in cell wall biosynthesis